MKRFVGVLMVIMLLVSMFGILTAYAGSAKVTFSGPRNGEIQAGKTYTIKYTLKVSSACAANANIEVGGVFEKVKGGDGLFHDTIPNNTSKNYSGSVQVKVRSGAQPGEKGTISVNGRYSVLDENSNESSGSVSGGYSATVVTQLSATPKPETEGPKETKEPTEWEKLAGSVDQIPEGDKLMVDITQSAKIPASLLSALKAKKGVLEMNFGSYSCLIEGANLNIAESLKELDLSLSMQKDEALSAASGGQDVYQLHFAHSGQLPGAFTYRIKAEGSNPGDTLYLYYHYGQAGVMEGKQIVVVDNEGFVSFTIYHCSSYVVTRNLIDSAAGGLNAQNPEKDQLIATLEAKVKELEDKLTAAETAAAAAKADAEVAAAAQAPAKPVQTGLPIEVVAAVALGAVLIAVFITMLACKAGPFKRGRHA